MKLFIAWSFLPKITQGKGLAMSFTKGKSAGFLTSRSSDIGISNYHMALNVIAIQQFLLSNSTLDGI